MTNPGSRQTRQSGMALLMMIGVVALLVAIIIGLRTSSEATWDENTISRMRFQARILAESGANLAQHPDIEPGDPVLRQEFDDGRSFQVLIKTENGRINVNQLAEDFFLEGATELFIRWGLDAGNAAVAAESLADWIDTDSEARSNGAEQTFYSGFDHPEFPPNESFTSLESMLLVRGMDEVARMQPLWRDYFTIYGDGTLDLNSAAPEVIEAFLGVSADAAFQFVATRNGDDGIEGTEDDEVITDTGEARSILGINESRWQEISTHVTLEGSLRRIESIGRVGEHQVRLIVLSEGTTGNGSSSVARFTD